MLLDEIAGKLTELISFRIAPEVWTQHRPEPRVTMRRCATRAMLQTEAYHAAGVQAVQIVVGENRRCGKRREHTHRNQHFGVGHERQVDQALDRPSVEVLPDFLIFRLHFFARRMRRHVDAEQTQAFERTADRARVFRPHDMKIDLESAHRPHVDSGSASGKKLRDEPFRFFEFSVEKFTLGALEPYGERELIAAVPALLAKQGHGKGKILACRSIGRRSLGALSRYQVQLCEVFAFLKRSDQLNAEIKLIDDLEDRLFPLFRSNPRCQQPAYLEMHSGTRTIRDQRVRAFLNAIVEKAVKPLRA